MIKNKIAAFRGTLVGAIVGFLAALLLPLIFGDDGEKIIMHRWAVTMVLFSGICAFIGFYASIKTEEEDRE